MNGDVEEEAPRPRPLSSGIWTLFSWLRRTERSSSSESISSVGSDRTAASFDFLAPFHYKHVNEPLVLPQSPITETYKKRLLERNIRRQNDQDLTLRRKYGLYTEEGLGYDAFSLPPARKIPKDSVRLRRATSEGSQRRAAYVPGKRRAPLPPTVNISNSLPRNYKRKRPAPKPPTKLIEENKENIEINKILQMDSNSAQEKRLSENSFSLEYKIEKPIKQDHPDKDVKLRSDKSFLKQIIDSKKRYSAIDTTHVKLLPSISELDKQAAEIIESKRSLDARRGYNNDNILKLSGTEGNWMCTICLRKYKMTITSCSYCVITKEPKETVFSNANMNKNVKSANASNTCTQTENVNKSGRKNDVDEKKKLREMLKEMKDSLPKRPKHDKRDNSNILPATETPTLPIGSTMKLDQNLSDNILFAEISANKSNETKVNIQQAKNSFLLSQPCSSKQIVSDIVLSNLGKSKVHNKGLSTGNFGNSSKLDVPSAKPVNKIYELPKKLELLENKVVTENKRSDITVNNISTEPQNVNKVLNLEKNELKSVTKNKESITALPKDSNTSGSKALLHNVNKDDEIIITKISKPSNHRKDNSSENFKTTQDKFKRQSVLIPIKEVEVTNEKLDEIPQYKIETIRLGDVISSKEIRGSNDTSTTDMEKNSNLNSPLKISSLLNPIYYPKKKILEDTSKNTQTDANKIEPRESPKLNKVSDISKQVLADTKQKTSFSVSVIKEPENTQKNCSITETKESIHLHEYTRVNRPDVTTSENNLDKHARRRDLVNQLEQAISKGDEQTAAEAAAKLAKLKLSCSVLSFSSQIVAEPKISPKRFEIPKSNPLDKENTQNNEVNVSKKAIKIDNLSQTQKNESNENRLKEKPIIKSKSEHTPLPSTSKDIEPNPDQIIPISVWIEDKEAARGPIRLNVPRKSVVGDLKKEAEVSLGLEIRLQRWIIGRTLCSNDNTPLTSLAGADLVAPFYLCVVESETKTNNADEQTKTANKSTDSPTTDKEKNLKSGDFYIELMKLEQQALVPNTEVFECGVCIEECAVGAGAVLRECIHTFCRECLCDVIRHCEEPVVSCPAIGCPGALQEREIRALLTSEEYEKWLARGLAVVESGTRNTFHCRTRDCTGWAFCEPGVRRFPCPVCKHTNCLPCQAVHEGETCERYQEKLRQAVTAVEANQTDEGTQALLKSLIDRGEALECPECKAIITKKWGCDWIKCSACKTEICWVTKGRRWGPGGKGDTSGGCRCGIDGKRCHPSCGYCH